MSEVTADSGPAPNQSHPVIPEGATIILPVRKGNACFGIKLASEVAALAKGGIVGKIP